MLVRFLVPDLVLSLAVSQTFRDVDLSTVVLLALSISAMVQADRRNAFRWITSAIA
jgi:hypothetical protein